MTDKEKKRLYDKLYREKNREKIKARGRKYYTSNKEKIREKEILRREKDPEKYKIASKKAGKKYRDKNKHIGWERSLKRKYNISAKEYSEILSKQGGKCAICGINEPTGKRKYFSVDHCHKTNRVRGLLCSDCNSGIGMLKDEVSIIQKAYKYLLSYEELEYGK